jgi:hypothetical protein
VFCQLCFACFGFSPPVSPIGVSPPAHPCEMRTAIKVDLAETAALRGKSKFSDGLDTGSLSPVGPFSGPMADHAIAVNTCKVLLGYPIGIPSESYNHLISQRCFAFAK